jgi:hypothetical protein
MTLADLIFDPPPEPVSDWELDWDTIPEEE